MKWYTLNTKPHAEYRVAGALRERYIQIFLPEIKTRTTKKLPVQKPFFPGYLFAKLDLDQTGISVIQWTSGLRRIVMFDNQPAPIDDDVIELIRQKVDAFNTGGGKKSYPFKNGDTVRITTGPFYDMLATFDRADTGTERVQILLNILGHASRLQLTVADLEKVNDTSPPLLKRPRRTRGQGRRIKQLNR